MMFVYVLKHYVGSAVLLLLSAYLLMVVLSSLPKIILFVIVGLFFLWLIKIIIREMKASYRFYLEYDKPKIEAMKRLRKEAIEYMKADLKTAWTNYKNRRH